MRLCSVEGCENKHQAKGYCMTHYYRVRRYGRLHLVRDGNWYRHKPGRPETQRRCGLPHCDRRHYARDLCHMHWKRARADAQREAPRFTYRFDAEPLKAAILSYVRRHDLSLDRFLRDHGLSGSRWKQEHFTDAVVDRICVAIGENANALYPDFYEVSA